MEAHISNLERVLAAGHFAVTVEVGPPRGPSPDEVVQKAQLVKGIADAYNVTDNQTAVVRMSSIAASKILLDEGLEPVMQMVCRDRNRIALQSDLLGAHALGIRNCLFLSGDHQSSGASGKLNGHPGAKNVFDIDSIQLLTVARGLGEDGVQEGGDPIEPSAPLFIGAAWTPFGPPESFRVLRLQKKIDAGARFIQTQAVYDVERFAAAMAKAHDMGLTERAAILPGVIVPRSAGMLSYMQSNVAGIEIPEEMIARMKGAAKPKAEGKRLAAEIVEALKAMPGVRGVHIQAIEAERILPDVVASAGLLPRPKIDV